MSDVSPSDSVSNAVSGISFSSVLPFPFSQPLIAGQATESDKAVLIAYYNAVRVSFGARGDSGVVEVKPSVSSGVGSVGKWARSNRKKRDRRRSGSAAGSMASSVASVGIAGCQSASAELAATVVPEYLEVARALVDSVPTFQQVLSFPRVWYKSQAELASVRLCRRDGTFRLGGDGPSLLATFAMLLEGSRWSSDFGPGLSAVRVDPVLRGKLSLRDTFGPGAPESASVSPQGKCYVELFRPDFKAEAVAKLGMYPTLVDVFSCPFTWYCSLAWVKLVEGKGCWHVERATSYTIGSVLLAKRASLEARVSTLGLGEMLDVAFDCSAVFVDVKARVGGVAELKEAPSLAEWFASVTASDVPLPRGFEVLLSKSAAMHDSDSKRRLKVLEALGDSVLTTSVALKCHREARTAQQYQEARSSITSNSTLSAVYGRVVPDGLVSFPAGVVPSRGNVGAYFLEAVLGVVYDLLGADGVGVACERLGLFEQYNWG